MEKTDNSAYWLAFASIEEVGAAFIRKVYEHFGSIKSAWCAGPDNLYRIEDITKKQMDVFLRKRAGVEPEKCLELIQKRGIKFINFEDENYPKLLKEIHNPPMTLFYKGDFSRCNLDKTLAVVGSRRASEGANSPVRIFALFRGSLRESTPARTKVQLNSGFRRLRLSEAGSILFIRRQIRSFLRKLRKKRA